MDYQMGHKVNVFRQLWLFLGLGLCLLAGSSGQAAELIAKKDAVKVHSEKSTKSPVVATLKKGEVVSTIKRAGMLWKVVTASGSEGYVKVFDVKIKASDNDGLVDAMRDAARSDGGDMDTVKSNRSRSAVMGVRGLDESSKTSFAGNVKPNFQLVDRMEGYRVSGAAIASLEERILKESELRAQK
jgi:hypothetical protein